MSRAAIQLSHTQSTIEVSSPNFRHYFLDRVSIILYTVTPVKKSLPNKVTDLWNLAV